MTEPTRAHWASLEETGVLWGMRLLLWVYRRFGRASFRLVLYPVVSYYFLANGTARRASLDYLARVARFFPSLRLRGTLWHSYRHFIHFAETLLDKVIVWLEDLGPERVTFHNRAQLAALIEQGRGAILLGSHLGNLEVCRALAELRDGVRLNILVHTKHAEKFNRIMGGVERHRNIELLQVTELTPATAIRLQQKLDRGELLVMVGDRVPIGSSHRTSRVDFLGAPADFPQGPYLLGAMLGCPMFTLIAYRTADRYHIYLEPFAERLTLPRRDPARREALACHARAFAIALERHCERVPLQWFNFYPFWEQSAAYEAPKTHVAN